MLPLIKKECILFHMKAATKQEVIRKMVNLFEQGGYLKNASAFYQNVLDRESIFPTYISNGIGFPHGKSWGVAHAGLCIVKLAQPVCWSEKGEDPVKMIIMTAVNSEKKSNLHLQILPKISRLLMYEYFRAELMSGNEAEVYSLLADRLGI